METNVVQVSDLGQPASSVVSPFFLQCLKDLAHRIEHAVYTNEVQEVVRAVRETIMIRHNLNAKTVSAFFIYFILRHSKAHSNQSNFPQEDISDSASSSARDSAEHHLPEIEIYCYLVGIIFMIDREKYNEAKACASATIARLTNINRSTVHVLLSKVYFYYSLSHELTNSLAEIRGNLLALHRKAILRHDELGQEVLLNLLLRNYLHYNLYDQAEKLRSKAPRFEAHSIEEFCRYLFYLGKIRIIQLEYTDAKESLLQAAQKAPYAALGFRIQCNKWAILARLLLGEIPERTVYMQKEMKEALIPYFRLTNAVRIGNLELFRIVVNKFSSTFTDDKTNNLVVRLRHNVIRTGLRSISISYSRISLADVAKKLRLDSEKPAADVEGIVAKAIRDGMINATIDHANGWMLSKENDDIYSTYEPQNAFHSRILFCFNIHNEAVKAMRFPYDSHNEGENVCREEKGETTGKTTFAEEEDDDF